MEAGLRLDAGTWSRIGPLLDEALDLPPAERTRWLAALPEHAADLRDTLRDLLERAATVETGDLLASLPKLDATGTDSLAAPGGRTPHAAGDAVGPYRLQRELGVGGMGSVWLATRTDGLMQQRSVALKLPHGPFRADLAARLAREREILATLDHPHIARLYDAGVAADGQPYLALEVVDGERIDRHAEARGLDVQARLRLFLQAARAVAHAHAQLVVHRDIKPSNLLVDAKGQVKLLDFGIARLLEDGRLDVPEVTQQGHAALTPDYASPEQIAGGPVGTRSDVYSLGVLLFELLTGTRPYRLPRRTRGALEDAILAAEVPRPSDAATDPARRRALRGDLDTIVLKALKKVPEQRYAGVDALVDDIERHLAKRPVLARPDGAWYRAGRFVVRNRLAVGTAAALLATLCAGAGVALWQARVAVAERRHAEEVKNFVAGIFEEANPYSGGGRKDLTAVDLLKQADTRLAKSLIGRSAARVELGNTIGASLLSLGDLDAAEPIIDRTVREAEQALAPSNHQVVRALMLRSQVHRMRGRPRDAAADADRILPVLRDQVDAGADGPYDLVIVLAHRAQLSMDLGANEQGEAFAKECVAVAEARLAPTEPQRVNCAMVLALLYSHAGNRALGLTSAERAWRQALVAFPDKPHRRKIEARVIYGRALADSGDLARGLGELEAAVAESRALLGPATQATGLYLQNMIVPRVDLGDLDGATATAAEALDILARTMGRDAPRYAVAEHTRALAALARRDAAAAQAAATHAAEVLARTQGPQHENTVAARTTLALALMQQGRLDDAARELETAAPGAAALAPRSLQNARVAFARGLLARLRGDADGALRHWLPLAESTETAPRWQRERMRTWAQIGWAHLDRGAPAEAVPAFERALGEFQRLEAHVTPARAEALLGLGRSHLARGEPARSIAPLERADAFWRAFAPASPLARETADALARARAANG